MIIIKFTNISIVLNLLRTYSTELVDGEACEDRVLVVKEVACQMGKYVAIHILAYHCHYCAMVLHVAELSLAETVTLITQAFVLF